MIRSMPTSARLQQRYDHRLRNLVQRTGDVTVATDLGVPRSTARGWLGAAPTVVVCLDGADLTEPELRQELLKLRRAVRTHLPHFPARVVVTPARTIPIVLEELSGARKRPMIRPMPTTGRPQQRYDHRLQHLVHRTGDVTIATDLGVPRSTARGWLGGAPTVVVCLDVADLTAPELRQES